MSKPPLKPLRSADRAFAELRLGYIGLADGYWLGPEPTPEPKQYVRAVSIYQRALAVPELEERDAVCERLAELYEEQGDAEQAERWRQQAEVEAEGDVWLEPAVA